MNASGPVPIDVSGDIEGYFIIPGKGTAPDGMEADEFDVLPNDHVIDLEPLLNAAVLLETPQVGQSPRHSGLHSGISGVSSRTAALSRGSRSMT